MAAYGGDDAMEDVDEAPPRVRSQVVRTQKGRGFRERDRDEEQKTSKGAYDRDTSRGPGPAKCASLACCAHLLLNCFRVRLLHRPFC